MNYLKAFGFTVCLAVAGCASPPLPPPSAPALTGGAVFVSSRAVTPELPRQVNNLCGTALLRDSQDLEKLFSAPHPKGTYFILVNAANPTLGMLVYAPPHTLSQCASRPLVVSGVVKPLHDEGLVEKVWARHSIKLSTEAGGVQCIQAQTLAGVDVERGDLEGAITLPIFPPPAQLDPLNFL